MALALRPRAAINVNGYVNLFYWLFAALVIATAVFSQPAMHGDGREYALVAQAWFDHGSPDLRPADIQHVTTDDRPPILILTNPTSGFFRSLDGKLYCWHFFFYPLVTTPFKLLYHLSHGAELAAFQATNAIFYFLTIGIILRQTQYSDSQRYLFAGLVAINPVYWYIAWPHPEVMCWSFVTFALIALDRKQYALGSLCASVAALQNPPIVALAGAIALLSLHEKSWRVTSTSFAAVSVSLIPSMAYLWKFGVPSLIISQHAATIHAISIARMLSLIFDLNDGLITYLPVVTVGCAIAIGAAISKRDVNSCAISTALFLMLLGCEMLTNWNHGCAGLNRYLTWCLPICVWLIVRRIPESPSWRSLAVAALIVQGIIVVLQPSDERTSYYFTPEAKLAFELCPRAYSPDPRIFADRTLHQDIPDVPGALPLGYVNNSGQVVKLLASASSLNLLQQRFSIDGADYVMLCRKYSNVRGMFYIDHPERYVHPMDTQHLSTLTPT